MKLNRKSPLYLILKWAYQPLKFIRSIIRDLTYIPKRNSLIKLYADTDFAGLHIGCGPFRLKGWINTDLPPNPDMDFPLDISRSLPFPDNYFHAIYGEEVIEHITLKDGRKFFQEAFRILKPNGVIRLTTPDLDSTCRIFLAQKSDIITKFGEVWLDGEFSDEIWINAMFHYWGHQFLYTYKMLVREMEDVGFIKVTKMKPHLTHSSYAQLNGLETRYGENPPEWRFANTLIIEASKPDQ